jgi:hypothetical protein
MDVLAELSKLTIRKPLSESQVRDMVGAPTIEEDEHCVCGKRTEECDDAYDHMTHGY